MKAKSWVAILIALNSCAITGIYVAMGMAWWVVVCMWLFVGAALGRWVME